MLFTFETAIEQSERIGCIGVAVDSKADAVGYYERFGFKRFDRTGPRSDIVPMFLGLRRAMTSSCASSVGRIWSGVSA